MTTSEKDINDIFNDIFLCEENLIQEGYDEGLKAGEEEGSVEGFHLGYHRGAEAGAELGYYLGFALVQLSADEKNPGFHGEKIVKQLTKLKTLVEKFPRTNSPDEDIQGLMDEARALHKRLCSLLKLDSAYSTAPAISF